MLRTEGPVAGLDEGGIHVVRQVGSELAKRMQDRYICLEPKVAIKRTTRNTTVTGARVPEGSTASIVFVKLALPFSTRASKIGLRVRGKLRREFVRVRARIRG